MIQKINASVRGGIVPREFDTLNDVAKQAGTDQGNFFLDLAHKAAAGAKEPSKPFTMLQHPEPILDAVKLAVMLGGVKGEAPGLGTARIGEREPVRVVSEPSPEGLRVTAIHTPTGKQVGHMDLSGTTIKSAYVEPAFRRRGVATSMADHAEGVLGRVQHSPVLTYDGKRFAAGYDAKRGVPPVLPRAVRIAEREPAAIKLGSKVYRGQDHMQAIEAAQRDGALPSLAHPDFNERFGKFKEGFLTEDGNFVSRSAAAKLVPEAKENVARRDAKFGTTKGLHAEDLKKPPRAALDSVATMLPRAVRTLERDQIASPAFKLPRGAKVDGRTILTGRGHPDIFFDNNLQEHLTPSQIEGVKDGFVTMNGKFVSRDRARAIAEKSGQISAEDATDIRDMGGGLHSADYKAPKESQLSQAMGRARDRMHDAFGLHLPLMPNEALGSQDAAALFKAGRETPFPYQTKSGADMHKLLTTNGGFTFDHASGKPITSGYSVGAGTSMGNALEMPLAELTPKHIDDWLATNRSKFQPGTGFGGWVDNGKAYIEPTTLVADRDAAMALGKQRGEKAIGDLAKYASGEDGTIPLGENWLQPHISVEEPSILRKVEPVSAPTQHDLPRVLGKDMQKVQDVEDLAYQTFTGPQFLKWLRQGRDLPGGPDWYTRASDTKQKAIDALGDTEGPKAFRHLLDMLGASTARSRPDNNLRRASWWRGLDMAGLLDPAELRTSTLPSPPGMGHIAQRTHHFTVADLLERGHLDSFGNPKPASFVENLDGNGRPLTNDTRISTATLRANPKMALGIAGAGGQGTPRDWAYAPMERAFQRAAREYQNRGLLFDVPEGIDPTSTAQAQVWGGIDNGASHAGSFADIFDMLLGRTSKMWGVKPSEANKLVWQGNPFDLPLNSPLLKKR